MRGTHADVAQLVEHHLAKVRVASSNLVIRSKGRPSGRLFLFMVRSLTLLGGEVLVRGRSLTVVWA